MIMATGFRSSYYIFPEVAKAVEEAGLPVQVLLAQRLGLLPWDWDPGSREGPRRLQQSELLLGSRRVVPPAGVGRVSGGGVVRPSARAVRERRRLRESGLKVVAPVAPLPVDANRGTPRAVFVPPPFETVPEHPEDDGE